MLKQALMLERSPSAIKEPTLSERKASLLFEQWTLSANFYQPRSGVVMQKCRSKKK